MQRQILPFLEGVDHDRVDEVIWGHRLREDQTAWLLLLEMLNVANACLASEANDPLPDMGKPGAPGARPRLRMRFRNLLFGLNQKAAELADAVSMKRISSDDAWEQWLDACRVDYEGPGVADFSPLRERFDDFNQFERAIDLVRSTAISGLGGSKGIFNRFIAPVCPEALYWETGLKTDNSFKRPDPTYNTFTRAGTLLHIMISRSKSAPVLRPLLQDFLERDSQARRLVLHLQVDEPDDTRHPPVTYLPYDSHPRFDLLGEDYASILSIKAPDNEKLLWLLPLSALHLSLYHAEVAHEIVKRASVKLPLVCEIVAPRKTVVRQASIESLTTNADLSRQAVNHYLNDIFIAEEWLKIENDTKSPLPEVMANACAYIRTNLAGGKQGGRQVLSDYGQGPSVEMLKEEIIRFYKNRHSREFSKVHLNYGREAGLISKRGTNRYRYAPTDRLLQSLVLANVKHECTLEDFLDKLFIRYGIVIGPRQQPLLQLEGYNDLARNVSSQSFRSNQLRLESRLRSMGMLRRLSDSQAYVLNPLQPKEEANGY